jgi:lipopolysaccharide transport system ATP-binding protein
MRVKIRYETSRPVADAAFAVDLHRADGVYCAGINTLMDRRALPVLEGEGAIELVLPRLNLLPGCYLISVGILNGAGATYDLRMGAYPFTVMSDRRDLGVVYLDHEWVYQAATSEPEHPALAAATAKDHLRT